MSPADLERVTGYKQYTAQVRWFSGNLGLTSRDVPTEASCFCGQHLRRWMRGGPG
ncbi:DUF4224 domain-containing protein [Burkholderia cenocepacia]